MATTDPKPADLPASGTIDHPPPHAASAPAAAKPSGRRKWVWIAAILAVIALAVVVVPWLRTALITVSTDDAYVNGHVTYVAPRVIGQVARVLVDDNYRVKKGDILVQLDKEPYQVIVAIKKAAVDSAEADLAAANAAVRGYIATARANRFKLQHAIE